MYMNVKRSSIYVGDKHVFVHFKDFKGKPAKKCPKNAQVEYHQPLLNTQSVAQHKEELCTHITN